MVNSSENSQERLKKVRVLTMIMYVGENPSGAVCVPGWMRKGVLKRERDACESL
jgi:hypothetical protein